jgi:hypothetical protein
MCAAPKQQQHSGPGPAAIQLLDREHQGQGWTTPAAAETCSDVGARFEVSAYHTHAHT